MKKVLSLFIFLFVHSNSFSSDLKYEVIVSDIAVPWSFTFLPDSSILITERKGQLIHYKNGKKLLVENLPKIIAKNQGGLLDIELHPNYKSNGWIYISYCSSNDENDGMNTSIMRFQIKNNTAINKEIIYKATPNSKRSIHFGSRIIFDNQNYLFFSIGDRGNRDLNPQDITRDGGKIYRLHDDGRIPIDNPFVNEKNSKKAIYSYGHRNTQGMFYDIENNQIWTHEHGPRGGDEINIIEAGKNYGWPLASYGINYIGTKFTNKTTISGMEDPLHYWVPSIAPSGMIMIKNSKYESLSNSILIGSLKFQYLHQCILEVGKNGITKIKDEKKLLEDIGRVRSIEVDDNDNIYVGVENLGIIKLLE